MLNESYVPCLLTAFRWILDEFSPSHSDFLIVPLCAVYAVLRFYKAAPGEQSGAPVSLETPLNEYSLNNTTAPFFLGREFLFYNAFQTDPFKRLIIA